jgi:hypothetical protein
MSTQPAPSTPGTTAPATLPESVWMVALDDLYVLNYAGRYLARWSTDFRHTYSIDGQQQPQDQLAEAWRFPLIDTYGGGAAAVTDPASFAGFNQVTFVYAGTDVTTPQSVAVLGTFATLYRPIPLSRVTFEDEPTRYFALSYVVPKAQVHRYRFLVDGRQTNDFINPQVVRLDNGRVWSRFFTDAFTQPLVLERWEVAILARLSAEMLPFQTAEAADFLALLQLPGSDDQGGEVRQRLSAR